MNRRGIALVVASVAAAALGGACGGSPNSPAVAIQPQQITTQPVAPAPPNNLPVIESVAAKGRRAKQPPNFADLSETIDLAAKVVDEETAVEELDFQWSAPVGTFEGAGPNVAWRAPDEASTPAEVTITLKVLEKYGYPGGPTVYQQDVSSTVAVSLHNSRAELDDMARQFLLDFSDSNIRDVSYVMRNFLPGCYGTAEEAAEVKENRRRYRIIESRVGAASTTVNFGGICPFRGKKGDACTAVPVFWYSLDMDHANAQERATGTDWVASVYAGDKRRWFLCDSQFDGQLSARSTFIK